MRLTVACLQGIVNRAQPWLYLIHEDRSARNYPAERRQQIVAEFLPSSVRSTLLRRSSTGTWPTLDMQRSRSELFMVDEIKRWTPREWPAFLHVFLANWLREMGMATRIAKGLGPEYVIRPAGSTRVTLPSG